MNNVIYKDYAKEYIKQYNEASEFLQSILWNVIYLKHSKSFLNNIIPLSTKPIIEKIYNDVQLVFNSRINALLDEENNVLKNLEKNMASVYIHKSHRNKFIHSLEDLSWNSSEIANTRERLSKEKRSIQDAKNLIESAYEYLEKLAVDDASPLSYTEDKNRYEWMSGYFFELNDKHSQPISIVW